MFQPNGSFQVHGNPPSFDPSPIVEGNGAASDPALSADLPVQTTPPVLMQELVRGVAAGEYDHLWADVNAFFNGSQLPASTQDSLPAVAETWTGTSATQGSQLVSEVQASVDYFQQPAPVQHHTSAHQIDFVQQATFPQQSANFVQQIGPQMITSVAYPGLQASGAHGISPQQVSVDQMDPYAQQNLFAQQHLPSQSTTSTQQYIAPYGPTGMSTTQVVQPVHGIQANAGCFQQPAPVTLPVSTQQPHFAYQPALPQQPSGFVHQPELQGMTSVAHPDLQVWDAGHINLQQLSVEQQSLINQPNFLNEIDHRVQQNLIAQQDLSSQSATFTQQHTAQNDSNTVTQPNSFVHPATSTQQIAPHDPSAAQQHVPHFTTTPAPAVAGPSTTPAASSSKTTVPHVGVIQLAQANALVSWSFDASKLVTWEVSARRLACQRSNRAIKPSVEQFTSWEQMIRTLSVPNFRTYFYEQLKIARKARKTLPRLPGWIVKFAFNGRDPMQRRVPVVDPNVVAQRAISKATRGAGSAEQKSKLKGKARADPYNPTQKQYRPSRLGN